MFADVAFSALSLALILLSCFLFTNAVEWLGKKLNLGQGIVGSIFAAVGTALPETMIPIIAILVYHDAGSKEIGIGAIAGAPFMLGTLAFFVTGLAVIIYSAIGKRTLKMNIDEKIISKDLAFFLAVYTVAVTTTFIHEFAVARSIIAIILLLSYALYLKIAFAYGGSKGEDVERLFISRVFRAKASMAWIIAQALLSLAGILYGADTFIGNVGNMAGRLGVAPLVLSIIITPIATELPEMLNSIIWTGRKKDTLALGNITGAMVFQSCFTVVFGMLFTSWDLSGITLLSAAITIFAVAFSLIWIRAREKANPFILLFGGLFYAALMIYIFR